MSDAVVFARMSTKDVALIKRISKERGEDVSSFVRRAIKSELARLGYLSEYQRKALGIGEVSLLEKAREVATS
ncbi:MAG: hypothetical protein ACRECH_18490 [Nitrososphaerales archaeon]